MEHKNWFCNDPDGEGITTHATETDALHEAKACIEAWRGEGLECPLEVLDITVGRITHRAQEVNIQRPNGPLDAECKDLDGQQWHGLDDYRCNVEMRPTLQEGLYSIGQKVRYAPHYPGGTWDMKPWLVCARIEQYAMTHEGCLVEYELVPWPYTTCLSKTVAVCVRPDMLEPWPEEDQ